MSYLRTGSALSVPAGRGAFLPDSAGMFEPAPTWRDLAAFALPETTLTSGAGAVVSCMDRLTPAGS